MTNPPQAEFPSAHWQVALSLVAWIVAIAGVIVVSPVILGIEVFQYIKKHLTKGSNETFSR